MTKTFWEKLEEKQGTDSYFGPFHRLAMYRGRGGEWTAELQKARELRKEKPETPWHWLEFYNAYLDTLAVHHGSSSLKRNETFSMLQDGVTAIPVVNKHTELDLLSRIYHHCHETSGSRKTVDGVATRIFVLFSKGICETYNWVTANQCSFLVPVIAAHFLWAMKRGSIKIPELYTGLRAEQHKEGVFSHALKHYAQSFIKHFAQSFGVWHNEESFFYALKLTASHQYDKSTDIESFHQNWEKSPDNRINLRPRPVSQKLQTVVDIIQNVEKDKHQKPPVSQGLSSASSQVDEKTAEEHAGNHEAFWRKVEQGQSPFALLSRCHYQDPKATRLSADQKDYFHANAARKAQLELPWSFFEVFDKLCLAMDRSIHGGQPAFNLDSISVVCEGGIPSSDNKSTQLLLKMHAALSSERESTDSDIDELQKALTGGFKSIAANATFRKYDDVMTFFATAQLLHKLSKAGVNIDVFLMHLAEEKLRSLVSLYACQFIRAILLSIWKRESGNLDPGRLARVLMGNISCSQDIIEAWNKSPHNSVNEIKKRLGEIQEEAVREQDAKHTMFWHAMAKEDSPFVTLSALRSKPAEDVYLEDYESARDARIQNPTLPWTVLEIVDTLPQVFLAAKEANKPLFSGTVIDGIFGKAKPSLEALTAESALWYVFTRPSEKPSWASGMDAWIDACKNQPASSCVHDQDKDIEERLLTLFFVATVLHELQREEIKVSDLLSTLSQDIVADSISLLASGFRNALYGCLASTKGSFDTTQTYEINDLLSVLAMGKGSHAFYQSWAQESKLGMQQLIEHVRSAPILDMDKTSNVSTPPPPGGEEEEFEEVDFGPDPRQKHFSEYLGKIKAETYWTPARIAVSICLPFMAIWFAIESCLNRRGIRLREDALETEQNVGWEAHSAFRKPRHLHHAIWTGLTGCCRNQPVETRAIREWNQSQVQ